MAAWWNRVLPGAADVDRSQSLQTEILDISRLRFHTARQYVIHLFLTEVFAMTIVRWEPLRELGTLQSEMNRLFNTVFDGPTPTGGTMRRWMPAMDLLESGDDFVLKADLPGMSEEDVTIELEDSTLTISGERKAEHEAEGEGYYRVERASGSFSRSLTLPKGVDPEAVTASFDRGVLEVRIPKPASASRAGSRSAATEPAPPSRAARPSSCAGARSGRLGSPPLVVPADPHARAGLAAPAPAR